MKKSNELIQQWQAQRFGNFRNTLKVWEFEVTLLVLRKQLGSAVTIYRFGFDKMEVIICNNPIFANEKSV